MKGYMFRKAIDLADLKSLTLKFYHGCKECLSKECLYGEKIVIEKSIEISKQEFDEFCNGFLVEKDFIINNEKHMWYSYSIHEWHCLAISCAESDTVILAESEGYDYARYTCLTNKSLLEDGKGVMAQK